MTHIACKTRRTRAPRDAVSANHTSPAILTRHTTGGNFYWNKQDTKVKSNNRHTFCILLFFELDRPSQPIHQNVHVEFNPEMVGMVFRHARWRHCTIAMVYCSHHPIALLVSLAMVKKSTATERSWARSTRSCKYLPQWVSATMKKSCF